MSASDPTGVPPDPNPDLGIPEGALPAQVQWWLVSLAVAFAGFVVVSVLEPAGFDRCEGAPSPSAATIQRFAGGASVVGAVALAAWRLRGWWRVSAVFVAVVIGGGWLILLDGAQHC